MVQRRLSLVMLPAIFAILAGCSAPSAVQSEIAATPATIVFGSCPQKPVWPEAAHREKRQGAVALAFHIDADNTVLDAKVKRSSGHADLDEAARSGLAKCRFKAATQNGRPIREWAAVKYEWTL